MTFSKPSSLGVLSAVRKTEDSHVLLRSIPGGELLRALLGIVSVLLCFSPKQWGSGLSRDLSTGRGPAVLVPRVQVSPGR